MKPFDLEKAKAGAPVQTRGGQPARIICFDCKGSQFPVIALVTMADGEEAPNSYTNDGRYHPLYEMGADLVMAPVQREGWVNVYSNKYCNVFTGKCVYETEAEGRSGRSDNSNYLATVKITWEE